MHYARLENNVVVETYDTDEDITTLFPAELVWIEAPAEVEQRWMYDSITAIFLPPPILIDPNWRQETWDEYRGKRDLYLGRLSDIAGRYQRKGDTVVPPAADAIAEGLLAMPDDPAFLVCQNAADLQAAVVAAANALLRRQLTNPATALGIKAALDKVFK